MFCCTTASHLDLLISLFISSSLSEGRNGLHFFHPRLLHTPFFSITIIIICLFVCVFLDLALQARVVSDTKKIHFFLPLYFPLSFSPSIYLASVPRDSIKLPADKTTLTMPFSERGLQLSHAYSHHNQWIVRNNPLIEITISYPKLYVFFFSSQNGKKAFSLS